MNFLIQELLWTLGFAQDYPEREVVWVVRVWRGERSVILGRYTSRDEAIHRARNVIGFHKIDTEERINW